MAKPTDDIEFATNGAALISDPGGTKKKLGFLVSEKPPAHWFDWLFRAYWRWISWLTSFTSGLQASIRLTVIQYWQNQTASSTQQWQSVTWSPELGLFCAVAFGGTAAQQVMTSPDGITWTARTSPSARQWMSVTWSPELGLFCAVATDGTVAQQVVTSPDGITWTARTSSSARQWRSVTRSPELGLFCAVAADGTVAQQVMTSPDGITWTARTSSNAQQWYSITWSPELGLFCAVANGGPAAQQVMTSPDGITWTARTSTSAQSWRSVTWSPELGLFCAVANSGTASQQVMTSPDGITWTARTASSTQPWQSVTWSPALGLFCAVAAGGTASQQIMTSPNGITWNARISPSAQLWNSITWSPELGLFCAVAYSGTAAQQVMLSSLSDIRSRDVKGTTTNDDAPAGQIGEYMVNFRDYTTGLTLASGTPQAPASLALTAGDWDVTGVCGFYGNGGAITGTVVRTAVTLTAPGSGFPSSALLGDSVAESNVMPNASGSVILPVPSVRVTLASSQTVYLQALSYFSAGTNKAYGRLSARRVR